MQRNGQTAGSIRVQTVAQWQVSAELRIEVLSGSIRIVLNFAFCFGV